MTIDVTCPCGQALKFPISGAGRRGRCKACGNFVDIPAPEPDPAVRSSVPHPDDTGVALPPGMEIDDEDLHALVSPPRPRSAVPEPEESDREVPPEPWYYGLLFACAAFCILAGVAQFVIVFLARAAKEADEVHPGILPGLTIPTSFGVMVAMLLASLPLLLLVDMARNIREIRHRLTEGQEEELD